MNTNMKGKKCSLTETDGYATTVKTSNMTHL